MKKNETSIELISTTNAAPCNQGARKPYRKPVLQACGDVRDLTLGGSFGTGESGAPLVFKNR